MLLSTRESLARIALPSSKIFSCCSCSAWLKLIIPQCRVQMAWWYWNWYLKVVVIVSNECDGILVSWHSSRLHSSPLRYLINWVVVFWLYCLLRFLQLMEPILILIFLVWFDSLIKIIMICLGRRRFVRPHLFGCPPVVWRSSWRILLGQIPAG